MFLGAFGGFCWGKPRGAHTESVLYVCERIKNSVSEERRWCLKGKRESGCMRWNLDLGRAGRKDHSQKGQSTSLDAGEHKDIFVSEGHATLDKQQCSSRSRIHSPIAKWFVRQRPQEKLCPSPDFSVKAVQRTDFSTLWPHLKSEIDLISGQSNFLNTPFPAGKCLLCFLHFFPGSPLVTKKILKLWLFSNRMCMCWKEKSKRNFLPCFFCWGKLQN